MSLLAGFLRTTFRSSDARRIPLNRPAAVLNTRLYRRRACRSLVFTRRPALRVAACVRRRGWRWLWPAAALAALVGALIARRPEMFLRPQFWAEDGPVFFTQADWLGAGSLFRPYGGYHHLLLRAIAWATSHLPAAAAPAVYFYGGVAVLLTAAAAWFSPRVRLRWPAACVLAAGLIPHSGEVLVNLTNLQWITALGLIWLLVADDPDGRFAAMRDAAIAALLSLTGVFSVLFAPLFLIRAWARRSVAAWSLAGVVAAAAAVQAATIAREAEPAPAATWTVSECFRLVGLRVGSGLVLPVTQAEQLPASVQRAVGAAVLALLAGAIAGAFGQRHTLAPLAAACGLLIFAALYRLRSDLHALDGLSNGDRYFYLPKLLLVWLLLQAAASDGVRRIAAAASLSAILVATALNGRFPELTPLPWAEHARRIDAGEPVRGIRIHPGITFDHPGRRRQ